jgi:hypothetical protein
VLIFSIQGFQVRVVGLLEGHQHVQDGGLRAGHYTPTQRSVRYPGIWAAARLCRLEGRGFSLH